jgi:hypothetical protein
MARFYAGTDFMRTAATDLGGRMILGMHQASIWARQSKLIQNKWARDENASWFGRVDQNEWARGSKFCLNCDRNTESL